jgi:uncharacterized protein YjbI with pentapeptide repeats
VASGVVALTLAVAVSLLWPLTDVIAAHDVGLITGPQRATALQAARGAVRTQLLTLGAGVFAAGALIFTARNFTLSRRSVELQRQTFELTEQGQVTDRFLRAVEELGSDKLDVRIGGIYAMERVARDSPRDHPTAMEVLAAFVREHSREPWSPGEKSGPDNSTQETRPDVQAAVTVIGRRDFASDSGQINLVRSNLPAVYLRGAQLSGATFFQADLTRAVLVEANLAHAVLYGANLTGAFLIRANLQQANLAHANLISADLANANLAAATLTHGQVAATNLADANLADADLTRASLGASKLTRATLVGAKLAGANLRNADLTDANLTGADLTNADLPDAVLTGAILTDAELTGTWLPPDAIPEGWACPPGSGRLARVASGPTTTV